MKKIFHVISSFVLFIALAYILDEIKITMIIYPIILGSLAPDLDLAFGSHRNFLAHSISIPILIFLFDMSTINALYILAFAFHCLCDVSFRPSKWTGFYTIKMYRHTIFFGAEEKSAGALTTLWLFVNAFIGIMLFGLYIYLV